MKILKIPIATLLLGCLGLLAATAQNIPGWSLVWSDEFTQADGSSPDSSKWNFETGGGGWGNSELESYTSRTNNARIEGGQLVIEARKENYTGSDGIARNYTSARLLTKGKWSWTYGRMEARIKIPRGQGLWPAFWMLGANIDTAGVGWPACGEIDIMENIGKEPSTVHGTVHGPGYSGGSGIGGPYALTGGAAFADDFHVFAIEWETNRIRWYVDNQLYFTVSSNNIPAGTQWVFTKPQFLLLNVAVGGGWPGNPDGTTTFPQRMTVDYVRVYAATPTTVCGGNVLINPGFELGGLANWTKYGPNTYLESINNVPVHGGTNVFKVFGQFNGVTNYSGLYQDVACNSGANYDASAWAITPGGDRIAGGNTAWVEVSFRDAATNVLASYQTALITSNTTAGGWVNLSLTNLTAPSGTAFVRYQAVFRQPLSAGGSVLFDDLNLNQLAGAVPPTINSISPDGSVPFVNPTNKISFTASSPCAGIAANGVQVLLNGVDVSPLLLITGTASNRNVSYSGLATNVIYLVSATVTDINGLSTAVSWQFDTFSQANFIWEAEDFDYSGGQFINNPIPSSTAKTNSYFGRVGQQNVDKNETSNDGEHLYRATDLVATLLPTDFTRQKYLDAIAAGDANAKDYKVGYFYSGEWLNYTRTFPTGNYRIYGRLAGGAGATRLWLDRVTAGQGTSIQTTLRLGSFSFTGGGWQTFNFVPLLDTNGAPVTVALGGNATLRTTATGGTDPNYFMLVPALAPVAASVAKNGANIIISFLSQVGLTYLVRYKDTLLGGTWQTLAPVMGDGTFKLVADPLTTNSRFYQVVVQ